MEYLYVLDASLGERKHHSLVSRIEARLTELSIPGRMERLSILKSANETVRDAVKRGAKTIVAIGNDATVGMVLPAVVSAGATLGFIPVGASRIAQLLGIPEGVAACDCVAKRILARVDLGRANQTYFLFSLDAPAKGLVVESGGIAVESNASDARLSICNVGSFGEPGMDVRSTPTDGYLEAVVSRPSRSFSTMFRTRLEADTVLPVTLAKVKCPTDCVALLADGVTVVKTPVTVEVAPRKLAVIVGRNRRVAR